MAFNVNEIRSQLTLGGARSSLFQVTLTNPANGVGDIKVPFMVRASSIPAATLGVIEVPYFGRKVRLAGDRTFGEWSVVVMNDEDFLIRNAMEEWSNQINTLQGNLRGFGAASPLLYKSTASVTQYSKTGAPLREYTFNGIFPIEVSTIDLDWGNTDSIQEFSVTFAYDWWEVGGATGDAGGA
jgi:hypothetical protein